MVTVCAEDVDVERTGDREQDLSVLERNKWHNVSYALGNLCTQVRRRHFCDAIYI
jgi:hypothetical protein